MFLLTITKCTKS